MKIIDRIIFVIVAIFLLAIAAGSVLLAVDVISMRQIVRFLSDINIEVLETVILFATAIILAIVAVKILFVRPKKKKMPAYSISKDDGGEISVSITAIENTVRLALTNFSDIMDAKINIGVIQGGIVVSARVSIPTGVVIPALLEEVKLYTKEFVETHTGVTVMQVCLIATEYKNVDTANERKRIDSQKRREEKNKPVDAYASTHARMVLTRTLAEEPVEDAAETQDA